MVTAFKTITTEFPAIRPGTPPELFAGLILWAGWIAAEAGAITWPALEELRARPNYFWITGILAAIYLGFQWHLPYLRLTGRAAAAGRALIWHRRAGVLAPLIYFLHTRGMGYGVTAVLSASFLANAALSTFGYEPARRTRWVWRIWLAVHIATACLIVAAAAIHVVAAFYYE